MKEFPGTVERIGQGRKATLNDVQREWFERWFPEIENERLAHAMGLSKATVSQLSHDMGLKKSAEGIKAIWKRAGQRAAITNERNGCYERKRGKPVSEATRAGYKAYFATHGHNPYKNMSEDEKRAAIEKQSVARRDMIRRETRRAVLGFERQTKLTIIRTCKYRQSQKSHRWSALKRGYLLDEDCSESSPWRYVIFYDKYTHRSAKFEENCIKDGFRFEEDK